METSSGHGDTHGMVKHASHLGEKVYKSTEGSASSVRPFQSRLSSWVVQKRLES